MTGITNSNAISYLREHLRAMLMEAGREVSDDRLYTIDVSDTVLPESDLVAFGCHFPSEVVGMSSDSAKLTAKSFNDHLKSYNTGYQFQLCFASHGRDLKYDGLPDHEHLTLVLIGRILKG